MGTTLLENVLPLSSV